MQNQSYLILLMIIAIPYLVNSQAVVAVDHAKNLAPWWFRITMEGLSP